MSSFEVKKRAWVKERSIYHKPVAFEQMDDIFRKIEYVLTGILKKFFDR